MPAKMTFFLQPCDTHLFSIFKRTLQESWRRRKSEVLGGVVTHKTSQSFAIQLKRLWLASLGKRRWQQFLSEEACASLGWKGPPLAGNGADDVVSCLVVLVQGS